VAEVYRDAGNGKQGAYVDGYCDKYDSAPNNGYVTTATTAPMNTPKSAQVRGVPTSFAYDTRYATQM